MELIATHSLVSGGNTRGGCFNPNIERAIFCNDGSGKMLFSDDGVKWMFQPSTGLPSSSAWECMDWGFRADNGYGSSGAFLMASRLGKCAISGDGLSWRSIAVPHYGDFRVVRWVPELQRFFVLAGGASSGQAGFYVDGETAVNMPYLPSLNWYGCAYSPETGRLVACGVNNAAYSDDGGETWSAVSFPGFFTTRGLSWSSRLGLFVASGFQFATATLATSANGATWSLIPVPSLMSLSQNAWCDGLDNFIAIAPNSFGGPLIESDNGMDWNSLPVDGATIRAYNAAIWAPAWGKFFTHLQTDLITVQQG